ncbi:MAG: primase small subunit [Archaeoglobi archaeon]|nr:DNA primase catalytic subunit PriS [Candidatus Mnemosynella bozhongmuii]MDI3502325.1 primase small subunit [Archaeoglobi archaeon]MDK2781858.1 primase small subunit [Archaeoglobi archaeon]
MNEKTKKYLKIQFQEYYRRHRPLFPEKGDSREWGFILFDSLPEIVMQRHLRIRDERELREYLVERTPAHAFYSVALYRVPDAPNMKSKEWLGATLIFDLDAEKSAEKSYSELLEEMKREIIKLQEILEDDFGISRKKMLVVFSGSKGYHLHVNDESLYSLGAAERREIISYLKATGLGAEIIFRENLKTPWSLRIKRALSELLEDGKILEEMRGKKFRKAVEKLRSEEARRMLLSGKVPRGKIIDEVLITLTRRAISSLSVKVDEPVTADIHRLIRLPGSLHGGSSLRTTPVRDIDSFNPLVDAVVFGDEEVKVNVLEDVKVEMMENLFEIEKGIQKLPEYLAMYLLCRGVAEYGS